jgi:hypothetical protein
MTVLDKIQMHFQNASSHPAGAVSYIRLRIGIKVSYTREQYKIKLWRLFIQFGWLFSQPKKRSDYAIGLVTYLKRFDRQFKPNLKRLCKAFPDIQITVAVNGFGDQDRQKAYLKEIVTFCSQFKNVQMVLHETPQSLSKLWNIIMLSGHPNGTLILNDDIRITPFFREQIELSGLFDTPIGIINHSWSHFWITPSVVSRIGWFDERFPGVGEEDADFEARLAEGSISLPVCTTKHIYHLNCVSDELSYDQQYTRHRAKYTKENTAFFHEKWHLSDTMHEGYVWVRICLQWMKVKKGMETPNFYKNAGAESLLVKSRLVKPHKLRFKLYDSK